ncbi:MAG: glycerol-3-phosphate 1-O-acyltransferase PlsY [Victivallales bacterium]|nr:glycerol-3-phosphate 1-O-acyltransferase PlsY [Victivallales bacterium]
MNILIWVGLVAAVTYLWASIPWGLLIGKVHGIDIREHGSGNIGATNVRRVLGKCWGRWCFVLDFGKGFLPILAVRAVIAHGLVADPCGWGVIAAAAAAVAGHIWSVFIGFRGGKGVSTSAGLLLAIAPYPLLVAGAVWAAFFYSFRYVSLASIAAAVILPLAATLFSLAGIQVLPVPILILLTVLAILSVFRHRSNIKRLMAGTESRFERGRAGETK